MMKGLHTVDEVGRQQGAATPCGDGDQPPALEPDRTPSWHPALRNSVPGVSIVRAVLLSFSTDRVRSEIAIHFCGNILWIYSRRVLLRTLFHSRSFLDGYANQAVQG